MKLTINSPVVGVVDSGHPADGERRLENAMEPITATVVIIALVALAC